MVGRAAAVLSLALALLLPGPVRAQEPVDQVMIARIKQEGFQHSRVLETAIGLSDLNGPRPAGSAGYRFDNAAGCAIAMEAVRILHAIGARPRRTIRVALWDGEEPSEEYACSVGYVQRHFGDPATMRLRPEHARLSAYYNVDNGAGRIRGIYLQGNEAARPILQAWLEPFRYLGAANVTAANTGSTDHIVLAGVGLPGFEVLQDPLDYESRTHHTNLDVADYLIEDDLEQAAVVTASLVYHTAVRADRMPRPPLPEAHR